MAGNSLSVQKEICVWVLFAAADTSSCGTSGYLVLKHYLSKEYFFVANKSLSSLHRFVSGRVYAGNEVFSISFFTILKLVVSGPFV